MDLSTKNNKELIQILTDNGYIISKSRLYKGSILKENIVPGVVPIDKSSLIRFISDNKLNENVKTEDSNRTLAFLQKMYGTQNKCGKHGCVKPRIPPEHEVPRAISLSPSRSQNSSSSGGKRRKTNRRRKGTSKQKKFKTRTKRSRSSRY